MKDAVDQHRIAISRPRNTLEQVVRWRGRLVWKPYSSGVTGGNVIADGLSCVSRVDCGTVCA
jgi:formate hydrogenlyase subunit 6/NADH:ubiquinone oxidoreductase subunit I